jgi:hypothetical protein
MNKSAKEQVRASAKQPLPKSPEREEEEEEGGEEGDTDEEGFLPPSPPKKGSSKGKTGAATAAAAATAKKPEATVRVSSPPKHKPTATAAARAASPPKQKPAATATTTLARAPSTSVQSVQTRERQPPTGTRRHSPPAAAAAAAVAPAENMQIALVPACNTLTDWFRLPVLLFLGQQSRALHDGGFDVVIVGDEAINFHSASPVAHECSPVEAIVQWRSSRVRRTGVTHGVQKSYQIASLDTLRGALLNALNEFVGALNSPAITLIQQRCNCSLDRDEGGFFQSMLDEEQLTLTISYTTTSRADPDEQTHDVLARFTAIRAGDNEPPVRYLISRGRLYGAIGFLLERAELHARSGNAAIAAKYAAQRARLLELLDKGGLSCKSVQSAVGRCLAQTFAQQLYKIPEEQRGAEWQAYMQQLTQATDAQLSTLPAPEVIVDALIGQGLYPRQQRERLLAAVHDNQTNTDELLQYGNGVARDLQRL